MTMSLDEVPAAPTVVPRSRSLERLEAEIVALSSQLTAATSRLLVLVGEFDAADGWRQWGMRSTAHWLSWQCGLSLTAGREQVRVARALRALPLTAGEFAAGRLSYSKVRALTRVATADSEEMLVGWALHATAAQLDRIVAGQRRVARIGQVRARHDARRVSWRWDEDGSLVGSFRLPPEQGAILLQALESASGDTPAEAFPPADPSSAAFDRALIEAFGDRYAGDLDDPSPGPEPEHVADAGPDAPAEASATHAGGAARAADALVALATRYLDHRRDTSSSAQQERYQLVIHATTETLARDDDTAVDGATTDTGIRLHPESARRLTCDCPTSTLTVDRPDHPLHLGRRTRRIRGRTARALRWRDHGHCRAPGCTATATITHHIRHWARGGPTCPLNLISLCDAHHWQVHEGGWTIAVKRPGVWRFYTPDGRRLDTDHTTTAASTPLTHDPNIPADAITGHWNGEPLNIGNAVTILAASTRGRERVSAARS
jgi:hypothetical protein